jgi:uncharacterized protein
MAQVNRLSKERSPYLLQHARNPVDWYPWGDEAFDRARREDKPMFVSIGYSTCHWCHVMEHESFEDEQIAALLNRDFIAVKVDREERPDVDRVYMSFVQATTGSGGWPMSVFVTPALKPFFGGTYFPPTSRWGRPGFVDLLGELARVWKEDRSRVEQAATELLERLKLVTSTGGATRAESTIAAPESLDIAVEQFQMAFDRRRGGFGDAPKFPRPSELLFLLREHARRVSLGVAAQAPLLMVTDTLRAMALGGIRDHVGGGFHRYSVDGEWRVPHFEKMLYDQAQLALAYLEAAQATGEEFYATVAEDTLQYVLRELTDPHGGFYSAEDADSIPPEDVDKPDARKTEGAFYLWTEAEIERLLGDDAVVALRRFGVEAEGNALQDPHGELRGRNVLYVAQSIEDIAARSSRSAEDIIESLGRIRAKLATARAGRPRPHLDDKVLTAWNGLMIGALARAARVLVASSSSGAYLRAAQNAASFIRTELWKEGDRRLLRRFRDGEAAIDGFAEDYAFLIFGLIELFQADGNAEWLRWATILQTRQDALFWDDGEGGWFSTSGHDASVLLRLKEDYDGAEPAAGSVSVLNLIAMNQLGVDGVAVQRAERTLGRFGARIGAAARVVPMMLAGLSAWHATHSQVVIVGERTAPDTTAMLAAVARVYRPFAGVVQFAPDGQQQAVATMLPFVAAMTTRDGRTTAYVCQDFACREPVTSAEALQEQI